MTQFEKKWNRWCAALAGVVAAVNVGCNSSANPMQPTLLQEVPGTTPIQRTDGAITTRSALLAVPFKGSLEGTQTITPLQPPFIFVNGSASGTAAHLGQFTVAIPHTVNFITRTGVGTYTFTAANGDTLTADFTGQAQEIPPLVSIVEHATITGGTGRFAGATGTFTVERSFNRDTGATEGSFEGTISSVGAGKP
ncbi:MAG TPA: hypothetical protein VJM31_12390 [Vicinamibacterales bacterium]|nr:hypothetical protein [Vicinamibacterales bacterium]